MRRQTRCACARGGLCACVLGVACARARGGLCACLLESDRRASPFMKVKLSRQASTRHRAKKRARSCAAAAFRRSLPPPAAAASNRSSFTSCSRASEERRRASARLRLAPLTSRAASRTARDVSRTCRSASFWSCLRFFWKGRTICCHTWVLRCAAVEPLFAATRARPAVGSTGSGDAASVLRVATIWWRSAAVLPSTASRKTADIAPDRAMARADPTRQGKCRNTGSAGSSITLVRHSRGSGTCASRTGWVSPRCFALHL